MFLGIMFISATSQSPTGDFLLGRVLKATGRSIDLPVSIPHGGFFVGKAPEKIYQGSPDKKTSQSPTGDFLLGRYG